ncbi:MAG: zinc transporter ZntB [Gammaproteobacteria bacterium]|nr:zinc transporter ZntB [Gammaproteobacteria bacterium]
MTNDYGLLHSCILDGKGSSAEIAIDDIPTWTKEKGLLWLHFDYTHPDAEAWMLEKLGLDQIIIQALLVDETRPRATMINDGFLIAFRGINHNEGAEPDDMVALRMWIDDGRIITSRRRKLRSVSVVTAQLKQGNGPKNSADFLVEVMDLIVDGMSATISGFEESVADYEDAVLEGKIGDLRYELANLRRQAISLRRYLAPERDAFARLLIEKVSWITEDHRIQIREVSDSLIRHIENLDAVRERAAVTQEELLSRLSEQLNARMYVLSVVAAIFLPLGFLTGLLGINIGGIPGADDPAAFWLFIAILIAVVILQILIFRWKKWF